MSFNVHQLSLSIQLKKNIEYKDLSLLLSNAINFYFLHNEHLKNFHISNKFKLYNFSLLTPIEKDKIYKRDNIYILNLRFIYEDIFENFCEALTEIINPYFFILGIDCSNINIEKAINNIYTVTPAVITIDSKKTYIGEDCNIDFVKDRIIKNTNNKYAQFLNKENYNYDFINAIRKTNNKPISLKYKGGFIFSNKFSIDIKTDEKSQELALFILGAGLLEKNSLSFGYCEIGVK